MKNGFFVPLLSLPNALLKSSDCYHCPISISRDLEDICWRTVWNRFLFDMLCSTITIFNSDSLVEIESRTEILEAGVSLCEHLGLEIHKHSLISLDNYS